MPETVWSFFTRPAPTPTPTNTPTDTPTPTPTKTPTITPTPSDTPTDTPTNTPTATPTPFLDHYTAIFTNMGIPGPSARKDFCLETLNSQTLLLFGGSPFNNETWTFDGNAWTQQFPATSPSGRSSFGYGKNPVDLNGVVIFGGYTGVNVYTRELWGYHQGNWSLLANNGPTSRLAYGSTYVPHLGAFFLHGGWNSGVRSDSWVFNGGAWTQLSNIYVYPRVGACLFSFDGTLYMESSASAAGVISHDFMLRVPDNNRWWPIPNVPKPPGRVGMAYATHATEGYTLLFGGDSKDKGIVADFVGDMWIYDGFWRQVYLQNSPGNLNGARMAFLPSTGRFYLFGGSNGTALSETWEIGIERVEGTPPPTFTPSMTPTPSNTPTPTSTPTKTPTRTPTASKTPTFSPTRTPTRTPTSTPSATPTVTPTPTDTPFPTPIPTSTPAPSPTPTEPSQPVQGILMGGYTDTSLAPRGGTLDVWFLTTNLTQAGMNGIQWGNLPLSPQPTREIDGIQSYRFRGTAGPGLPRGRFLITTIILDPTGTEHNIFPYLIVK